MGAFDNFDPKKYGALPRGAHAAGPPVPSALLDVVPGAERGVQRLRSREVRGGSHRVDD